MLVNLISILCDLIYLIMGISANQYSTIICANIITIGYGISMGWTSPMLKELKNGNSTLPFELPLSENELNWIPMSIVIGGIFGQIILTWIVEKYGRKWCLYISASSLIVNWTFVLSAFHIFHIYMGQFFIGISGAGLLLAIPLYVTEISANNVRGILGTFLLLSNYIGLLLGFILGEFLDFFIISCLSIVIPLIFMVTFLFVPDTPEYLENHKLIPQAKDSIKFYHGPKALLKSEEELNKRKIKISTISYPENVSYNIKNEDLNTSCCRIKSCNESTRNGIMISFVLIILTQCTGVYFIVSNYTNIIFELAYIEIEEKFSSFIVIGIQLTGTALSTILIEKYSRNFLLALSSFFTSISLIGVAVYLYIHFVGGYNLTQFGWIVIVFFITTVFNASWGVTTLPFILIPEILSIKSRAYTLSILLTISWILSFLLLKYYNFILENLKMHGVCVVLSGFCIIQSVFSASTIPETNGLSIEKILDKLKNKN